MIGCDRCGDPVPDEAIYVSEDGSEDVICKRCYFAEAPTGAEA